jgi:phosphinothricin acetyltransferase
MEYVIDDMNQHDWEGVRKIYLEGIATGNATFENEAPDWRKWDAEHLKRPRLVVRDKGTVLGWAALSPVSNRSVYSGVAEVSLYVAKNHRGKSVGSKLLSSLIDASEKAGIWTLQGGIFSENKPSLNLFKKYGFRQVGLREKIGRMVYGDMRGSWRDVVLVERRSTLAGIK